MKPIDTPLLAPALAQAWREADLAEGDRPFSVEGTRIRHSWAAKCTREIAYRVTGQEESDPLDLPSYWTFGIGRRLHEDFQQELTRRYGHEADIEHEPAIHRDDLCDSSGHADTHIIAANGEWLTSVEIKTINGFGYKKAIGLGRGPATGPRHSAVVQAAVNGYMAEANEVRIVYLALESISKQAAERAGIPEHLRFCAEWVYYPEDFVPIAEEEIRRWNYILDTVDEGALPPRLLVDPELPRDATVTNPLEGAWFSEAEGKFGKTWMCDYCAFQQYCAVDPK